MRRWRRAVIVATACLAGVAAPAVALSLPPPLGPPPGDLLYHGGRVEVGPTTTYAIFWEPPASGVSPNYNALIERFLGDIGGSHGYGVTTQYSQQIKGFRTFITNNSSLGGSWVDTRPYPLVVTTGDIYAEIQRAMSRFGWAGGANHNFFVFTGPSAIMCTTDVIGCTELEIHYPFYCAYHGQTTISGQTIQFANIPDPADLPLLSFIPGCTPRNASPNHDPQADAAINIVNHELLEMVTDPDTSTGWNDASGQENGDKCEFMFGQIGPDGANVHYNGHPYLVQQTWSNAVHGCSL